MVIRHGIVARPKPVVHRKHGRYHYVVCPIYFPPHGIYPWVPMYNVLPRVQTSFRDTWNVKKVVGEKLECSEIWCLLQNTECHQWRGLKLDKNSAYTVI